jgi:hypothetical protein
MGHDHPRLRRSEARDARRIGLRVIAPDPKRAGPVGAKVGGDRACCSADMPLSRIIYEPPGKFDQYP